MYGYILMYAGHNVNKHVPATVTAQFEYVAMPLVAMVICNTVMLNFIKTWIRITFPVLKFFVCNYFEKCFG